jgi:hypothetical protein
MRRRQRRNAPPLAARMAATMKSALVPSVSRTMPWPLKPVESRVAMTMSLRPPEHNTDVVIVVSRDKLSQLPPQVSLPSATVKRPPDKAPIAVPRNTSPLAPITTTSSVMLQADRTIVASEPQHQVVLAQCTATDEAEPLWLVRCRRRRMLEPWRSGRRCLLTRGCEFADPGHPDAREAATLGG